jgi:predicted DNA-binding transcriptional regulator AlpA
MGELQIKDATRERLGLITPEELAVALEVTTATLQTWRVQDYGPRYVKLGKGVFYRYEEVKEWIGDCLVKVDTHGEAQEQAQSPGEAVA